MSSISWTRTVSQRCHWVVVPTLALMLACTQTPNEPEMHADVVQSTMRDVQQAQDDVPQSSMNSMPDVQQALTDGGRSSVPDATDSAVADVASGEALDASSDTWNSYAQMWFQTFCTSCHGAGNTRRDYT